MESPFKVFVPIQFEKGTVVDKTGRKRAMKFKGVASTMKTGKDLDGEVLDVNGFDSTHLLKSGHINYNHLANKDPLAIIGEPTSAKVVNGEYHIEGFLYEDSDLAKKVYKAAEILEKSGSTRRFGFSIEGMALERDPKNKKYVKKSSIMNVAICPTPKCAGTEMVLVKGVEDFAPEDGAEYLIDSISGEDRVIVDKSFNILLMKADEKIIQDDVFCKSVVEISEAISSGLVEDIEYIKKYISSFRRGLNDSVWVGGSI